MVGREMKSWQPETAGNQQSVRAILKSDHASVVTLLDQYASLAASSESLADRQGLIGRAGALLRALYEVKEQIVYPLLSKVVDAAVVQSACDDHKLLCEQLRRVASEDKDLSSVDKEMKSLTILVHAYFDMEEEKLLPMIDRVDTVDITQRVAVCRLEMLGEQGPD